VYKEEAETEMLCDITARNDGGVLEKDAETKNKKRRFRRTRRC
jgi:hypothetical protein